MISKAKPKQREEAAGYCRKSPTPTRNGKRRAGERATEKSIREQKEEIQKLAAKHGCYIPDHLWFVDEAWQGDDDNRPDFQRLFGQVQSRDCGFSKVFTYEQGRFSRADKDTAAYYYYLLRENDILLASCIEGTIVDPDAQDDLAQSITRDVVQFGKHRFLKDLGFAAARSVLRSAKQGIIGGKAPYGCRRREDGRVEMGDPAEVKVLRWIFEAFAGGMPRTTIARRLNADSVPSPCAGRNYRGAPCTGKWSGQTVLSLLQNPVYCGDRRFNRVHTGNHVHVVGDELVPVPRKSRGKKFVDPDGGSVPDVPAYVGNPIISQALWQRVQTRLRGAPPVRRQFRSLPLVGIVRCGVCGFPLISHRVHHKGKEYPYYRCTGAGGTQAVRGDATHTQYALPADEVWRRVAAQVQEDLLTPEQIRRTCERLELALRERSQSGASSLAELESQAAANKASLEKVKRNMLYADSPEIVAEFAAEVARLRNAATAIHAGIASAKALAGASESGIKRTVQQTKRWLGQLADKILCANKAHAADALRQIVKRATIDLEPPARRKGRWKITGVALAYDEDQECLDSDKYSAEYLQA